MGHATMENRHGLAVAGMLTLANGCRAPCFGEECSRPKLKKAGRRITVGEDKAYDSADHVANLRAFNVTPHVAQNEAITSTGRHRHSAIDGRTTRHDGYRMSQSCRAMTECIFGWGKQHGTMRKTKHRGIRRRGCRFPAQLHRLQSGPHPQTGHTIGCVNQSIQALHQQSDTSPTHDLHGTKQCPNFTFFRKLLGQKSAVHQLWRRVRMANHMGCDTMDSVADMLLMKC